MWFFTSNSKNFLRHTVLYGIILKVLCDKRHYTAFVHKYTLYTALYDLIRPYTALYSLIWPYMAFI